MRKDIKLSSTNEGVNMMKDRFCSKRVLIVLDDIDHLDQLKWFIESREWFGPGSRILITTRDKHLLDVHGVDELYDVQVLPGREAILLFSRHAFKQEVPAKDYEKLSKDVVSYAQSLPLALKVLGSFLYGMTIDEWGSALDELKRTSNMEIHNVLRISFDGLDNARYKEIFLDIACFFKGKDKDFVLRILQSGKFQPHSTIKVLCDRCLIMISDNKIQMHDLIQQMGWAIVREKFPKEPWKWSRLWDSEDIDVSFSREEGMKNIEVLSMDLSRIKKIKFNTKVFSQMKSLRLLKVHWSNYKDFIEKKNRVLLSEDFEFPSHELMYLYWDEYSLKSLPSNFDGDNIVELHFRYSSIKRLWKGNKCLNKLKVLDLSYSEKLIKMPKLSSMPNLKTLVLEGCINLQKFRPSMGDSNKLALLNLRGCQSLRRIPSRIELESLEILDLSDCTNIENFQEIQGNMGHLRELLLNKTSIKEIPIRMEYLQSLEVLDLSRCVYLKKFPDIVEGNLRHLRELSLRGTAVRELSSSIGYMESLEYLDLSGCEYFEKFPDISEGNMRRLSMLHLKGTAIRELPSSIEYLESLRVLKLSRCASFEKFPDITKGKMRHLRVIGLKKTAIRELPSGVGYLESLDVLKLSQCASFEKFPDIIEGNMRHIDRLDLDGTALRELPSSIRYLGSLEVINLSGCAYFEKFPDINIEGDNRRLTELNLEGTAIRELPSSIWRFSSLEFLDVRCEKLRKFPEIERDMVWIKKLDLSSSAIIELPTSIDRLFRLEHLYLDECKNLRSIPNSICKLRCLGYLFLTGCSNLKAFPKITKDMNNLDLLCLSRTPIKKLPWPIQRLKALGNLRLNGCKNLATLQETKGSPLASLSAVRFLRELDVGGWHLSEQQILNSICCLPSLETLNLGGNPIRILPVGITQLSNLKRLQLSHCEMLQEISLLPSSLRSIEAYDCPCLSASLWSSTPTSLFACSLYNCFESTSQEHERNTSSPYAKTSYWDTIISGKSGIPEWTWEKKTGNEVRIKLPGNWYEDINFLGFALFLLFDPCYELPYECVRFECKLTFLGNGSEYSNEVWFESRCPYDGISRRRGSFDPGMWLTYYPKSVVKKGGVDHPNRCRILEAFFDSKYINEDGEEEPWARPRKCGIHLVYKLQARNGSVKRRGDAQLNPNPTEEEPHHKRLKTP